MSGEEKGDAKQEQTADDRRQDGAANMPLSQAARIARLKAAEEQNRAAQQTAARQAAAIASVPAASYCPPAAAARQDSGAVVRDGGGYREPQAPNLGPQASRAARLQAAGLAGGQQAAVERLKELNPLDAKNHIRDEARGDAADETAEPVADRASNAADQKPVRDGKGLFVEGNPGGPGRPPGSKDSFPRNSYKAMKELIAGRILKIMKDEEGLAVQKSPAEIMADAILEGMQGKLVLRSDGRGVTYANPLHAVKVYQDYMLKSKELALRAQEQKKKEQGSAGGIRIVLPSVPVDPLLRPGRPPRPLRLLGHDPSKPLPDIAGLPTKAPASSGPVPVQSNAPNPGDAFDPAELIEDFEHPICTFCLGVGWVRDANGIEMMRCEGCEGVGRAASY